MDYYKNTSTEQLIRSMAESSDLYDPNLAGNTVLGENYVNMLAKLKQDNINTSDFDKNSVYQYLSDDNKINYIWNKYFNEDSVDKQTKDAEFANIAKFEQQRQVYEGMSGIGKVFGNLVGIVTAIGEGVLSIPNDLYHTFNYIHWQITGDEEARKRTEEDLGYAAYIKSGAQDYYNTYTNFNTSDFGNIVYQVANNIGRMAPQIVAAIITGGTSLSVTAANIISALGTATYMATIPGATANELFNDPDLKISNEWEGKDGEVGRWQVGAYVGGVLATEIISESAFAGKFIKFGIVDPDDVAVKLFSNKMAQTMASWALDAVGEGLEEMFAEIVEPMLKTAIIDKGSIGDVLTSPDFNNILMAGLVGTLSGGIMGGAYRLFEASKTSDARAELGGLSLPQYSVLNKSLSNVKISEMQKTQAELTAAGVDLTEAEMITLAETGSLDGKNISSETVKKITRAYESDIKNEEIAVKSAAALTKIYNQIGDKAFGKAMTTWLESQQNKANAVKDFANRGKYVIEAKNTFEKQAVAKFNTKYAGAGLAFKTQTEALSDNQRSIAAVLAAHGKTAIFGTVVDANTGGDTRSIYNAVVGDKQTVFVDSSLAQRYSQEYIVNQVINEELVHTLQMDNEGVLSEKNLSLLQEEINHFRGELAVPDMSEYGDLDPKSTQYAAEYQAKSMLPLLIHDRYTIALAFNFTPNLFTSLHRWISNKFKKTKGGGDTYDKLYYHQLAEMLNMYDTVNAVNSDTVEQMTVMASRAGRQVTDKMLKQQQAAAKKKWLNAEMTVPVKKSVQQALKETFYNDFASNNINEANVERLKGLCKSNNFNELNLELLKPENYKQSFIDSLKGTDLSQAINDILYEGYQLTINPGTGMLIFNTSVSDKINAKKLYDKLKTDGSVKLEDVASKELFDMVDDPDRLRNTIIASEHPISKNAMGEYDTIANRIRINPDRLKSWELFEAFTFENVFVHELIHDIHRFNAVLYNASGILESFIAWNNRYFDYNKESVVYFTKKVAKVLSENEKVYTRNLDNEQIQVAIRAERKLSEIPLIKENLDISTVGFKQVFKHVSGCVYKMDLPEQLANKIATSKDCFVAYKVSTGISGATKYLIKGYGIFDGCDCDGYAVTETPLASKATSQKYLGDVNKSDVTSPLLKEKFDTAELNEIKRAVNEADDGNVGNGDVNSKVYKAINPETQISSPTDIKIVKELTPFIVEFGKEFGMEIPNTPDRWQSLYDTAKSLEGKTDLADNDKRLLNVYTRSEQLRGSYESHLAETKNLYINTAIINKIETGTPKEYEKLKKDVMGRGVGKPANVSSTSSEHFANVDTSSYSIEDQITDDIPKRYLEAVEGKSQAYKDKLFKKLTDKNDPTGMKHVAALMKAGEGVYAKYLEYLSPTLYDQLVKKSDAISAKKASQQEAATADIAREQSKKSKNVQVERINNLFNDTITPEEARTLYNAVNRSLSPAMQEALDETGKTTKEIKSKIYEVLGVKRKDLTPTKKKQATKPVVETKEEVKTEPIVKQEVKTEPVVEPKQEVKTEPIVETKQEEVKTEPVVKPEPKQEAPVKIDTVEKVNKNPTVKPTTVKEAETINKTIYENNTSENVDGNILNSGLDAVLDESNYSDTDKTKVQFDKNSDERHTIASVRVLNEMNPVYKSQLDSNCDNNDVLLPHIKELAKASESGDGFKSRMANVILSYIINTSSFTDEARTAAIEILSPKASTAGHTQYVASQAIKRARDEMEPVTSQLEDSAKRMNLSNMTEEQMSGLTYDILGGSITKDVTQTETAVSDSDVAAKVDKTIEASEKRIAELEKIKPETAIEQKAIEDEIELRKKQIKALKNKEYSKAMNYEYRLADWGTKAKMDEAVANTLFKKYLAEQTNYTLKDLKNPKLRAKVLSQWADKARTLRYFAMLSSPTTWFKNIVGNTLLRGMDRATMAVTAVLSNFIKDDPQGYNFGKMTKISKGVQDFFEKNLVENGRINYLFTESSMTVNKYATGEQSDSKVRDFEIQRKASIEMTFGDKGLGKLAKKYQKLIDLALNAGDAKFCMKDFGVYMQNLLELNIEKIYDEIKLDPSLKNTIPDMTKEEMHTDENIKKILDNMPTDTYELFEDKAMAEVMKTYLRNSNVISRAVSEMSARHPAFKLFASMTQPFIKVSVNSLITAVDYSPLGFLKFLGMKMTDAGWFNKELSNVEKAFRKSDETRTLAKATVGTTLMGIGAILAALGLIDYDDDDFYGAVINIGDMKIKISDLAPAATPLVLGASLIYADKHDKSVFEEFYKAFSDSNILSSMDSAFEYNESVTDYLSNLFTNYATSYIPSVIKNFAKIIDNNKSQKSSNKFVRFFQSIADGLPFISLALPKKADPYTGDFEKRYGVPFIGALLNSFSPVKIKYDKQSDVEKFYKKENVTLSAPSREITIDGKKIKLSDKQYREYVAVKADYLNKLVTKLKQNSVYMKKSSEEKKAVLKGANTKATNYAKKWYVRTYKNKT